jgi:hypothetical protein
VGLVDAEEGDPDFLGKCAELRRRKPLGGDVEEFDGGGFIASMERRRGA